MKFIKGFTYSYTISNKSKPGAGGRSWSFMYKEFVSERQSQIVYKRKSKTWPSICVVVLSLGNVPTFTCQVFKVRNYTFCPLPKMIGVCCSISNAKGWEQERIFHTITSFKSPLLFDILQATQIQDYPRLYIYIYMICKLV